MNALESASREWRAALIDVGGTNRLLHFRATGTTLDLAGAQDAALTRLLDGGSVTLAELFDDEAARVAAVKAVAGLAKKQQEALEEYGVSIAYLAAGLCSWEGDGAPSAAPVLLRGVELVRRRGARESWSLRAADEFQVNPVLLHVLNSDRVRVDDDELLAEAAATDAGVAFERLAAACADLPGFAVAPALVVGAFSYAKQPMVDDVTDLAALAGHDVVSALAGDLAAAERVRASGADREENAPDYEPVETEYLVLDADASQAFVVDAAVSGRSLVVEGPPGTGKSQTIANIIAASVAAGRSVLFVAQKRAAISAVLDRLDRVELGHLVLDLFAATNSRRYVADQLRGVLERQGGAVGAGAAGAGAAGDEARVDELHYTLTRARDLLVRHKDALHSPTRAWGTSAAEMIALSLATPSEVQSDARLLTSELSEWDALEPARIRTELTELTRLGALDADWFTRPGWSPGALGSEEALRTANDALAALAAGVGSAHRARVALGGAESRLAPTTWPEFDTAVALYSESDRLLGLAPGTLDPATATGTVREALLTTSRDFRSETGERMRGAAKRAAVRAAKAMVGRLPRRERAAALRDALELRQRWEASVPGADATFRAPEGWRDAAAELEATRGRIAAVDAALQGMHLGELPLDSVADALRGLAADQRRAASMPRAHQQRSRLEALGLTPLLDELVGRDDVSNTDPARAALVFDRVVSASVLDEVLLYDSHLAGTTGAELAAATEVFRRDDVGHLAANAARIRRLAAERLASTLDGRPDQHLRLTTETTRKSRFTPVRKLMTELPEAMLAAKPVWAMSPLQVSRLLPARAAFDLVVFDEASQVAPADAIPAVLRGRHLVVAGDSRQLPPTEFFTKTLDAPDDELAADEDATLPTAVDPTEREPADSPAAAAVPDSASVGSLTRDAESILFAMDRLLSGRSRRLLWHYRSRDERLIAVSNAEVYDGTLTTFPAADTPDAVRHVLVPPSPGIGGGTNSPEGEVAAVVEAVREHARSRPGESLGVIAFGLKHQRRLESALAAAFAANPALEDALVDDHPAEPFFVKSIERVQGDERDAIILSVGYGVSADGRLRLFWGPLLQPGGERRLNVAISRARRRMTLVSSFGPELMAEDAHPSRGYRLMRRFLVFMASADSPAVADAAVPSAHVQHGAHGLDAFERDVRDRLTTAGIPLDTRVGVGSYRIELAARHPEVPGRHVLAIETDGGAYRSGHTARERDRLRQELLERRGWSFHRIWSTDWFADPDSQTAAALTAYRAAVARAD
ncbi:AAA domain-containing protein [Herbiconiux moechotypicola]|uniref:DUF4011 domain-containing protein n=1 Tax=Herbiconiux moechotypicola TaxID=637393 RepID=A0ABP5Q7P2_9MICO|nr:AAA domain-containing protein [Herbiconiux moechotypicola]MCS5729159.1 AAA domain-containing protein [Herbiconiux moechotypicola]